ncbi:MAG: glycosyltransferase family 39 protein [Anaerolineae bacterium]|nr:glycosyltransferase family 39 protein [Anaerolineae bacterium]
MNLNPKLRPRLIAAVLFLIALLPRIVGLRRFLTSDENTNIFFAGSNVIAAFLQGDLRGTYWHFYPGVTMSWLDAIGMTVQYGLDSLRSTTPPFTDYIYGDILGLLVANRLPYAILTALAVSALYWLARQVMPNGLALLGALFLAFDPFYLAHSRVAHGDAPVAVFMSLSALTFYIYVQRRRNTTPAANVEPLTALFFRPALKYLVASAVLGGLAALTKAPGQFMALFVIGASLIFALLELSRARYNASRSTSYVLRILLHGLIVIGIWGIISLFVFVVLWPSMWVDPLGTFRQMLDETFGKVNEGHLVYFFGRPMLNPGPWFYPYVIPFRMTPVALIGCLLSLFILARQAKAKVEAKTSDGRPSTQLLTTLTFLWIFVISLLIFGNLSPKKQDRYLLPLFPFLDLLAAIGWGGMLLLFDGWLFGKKAKAKAEAKIETNPTLIQPINQLPNQPTNHQTHQPFNYQLPITNLQSPISNLLLTLLLILYLLPTFTYYPYYLTYFNPLMGGPTTAAHTTLMGWGEGMEQVADYLNTKPNAANLYVASTPSQTLLPYFVGTGENFYTNDIALRADVVVLYLAQMQRMAPSPDIVDYFQAQTPEHVVTIKGVPYAKIYPGPKLILTDIPAEATPINIGLGDTMRLAGYALASSSATGLVSSQENQANTLTLYWHALAPITTDYTISVRGQTDEGTRIVQHDQWPVDGLLPTSQWRQGDYVTDRHTLFLPPDAPPISQFEIVVYDAATDQTLGPPITIPNQP